MLSFARLLIGVAAAVTFIGGGALAATIAQSRPERADFLLSRAVFLGKYQGFGAGLQARMASIFGPLFGLRLGELKYTLSGQKIDGSQQ